MLACDLREDYRLSNQFFKIIIFKLGILEDSLDYLGKIDLDRFGIHFPQKPKKPLRD